jgi:hypothetical protein
MTIAERMKLGKGVDTGQNEEIEGSKEAVILRAKRIPRDLVLIGIAVLLAAGSFGLGVVAGREGGEGKSGGKVLIEKSKTAESAPAAVASASDVVEKPSVEKPAPVAASGGQYVASKTGTKYYLPWCGSVKRIKDENKVWFTSKAEAEAAGYEPAKNCKGI